MIFSNDIIEQNIIIFRPKEKIGINNEVEFENILNQLRESYPKLNLILDLSKVEYASSSALQIMVTTYRKLKKSKLKMVLLNPVGVCKKIIEVIELGKVIDVYTSENEALDAIKTSVN